MRGKKACFARHFALLRNSPSTVSTYADECELLVFDASLTSASLSKNRFFDSLAEVNKAVKTSNSHSSAYVDTVECELRSKSKHLA